MANLNIREPRTEFRERATTVRENIGNAHGGPFRVRARRSCLLPGFLASRPPRNRKQATQSLVYCSGVGERFGHIRVEKYDVCTSAELVHLLAANAR